MRSPSSHCLAPSTQCCEGTDLPPCTVYTVIPTERRRTSWMCEQWRGQGSVNSPNPTFSRMLLPKQDFCWKPGKMRGKRASAQEPRCGCSKASFENQCKQFRAVSHWALCLHVSSLSRTHTHPIIFLVLSFHSVTQIRAFGWRFIIYRNCWESSQLHPQKIGYIQTTESWSNKEVMDEN